MSFVNANAKFRNGEYREALDLYLELEKKYGKDLLAINIESCKRKIKENNNYISTELVPMNEKSFLDFKNDFDDITKVLVDNFSNSMKNGEREKLINEINKNRSYKSEFAEVKDVNPIPNEWPKDLNLMPLPSSTNDFEWHSKYKNSIDKNNTKIECIGLSVVIPTYNRTKILEITLASLANQKTDYPFEVIVADDGSIEPIIETVKKFENRLDIKMVRQKDYGYQLCAVRNLGIRTAKYDFISILDCDMAANPTWVQAYIEALLSNSDIALIGPRKYIDTKDLTLQEIYNDCDIFDKMSPVKSDSISTSSDGNVSTDWRLKHFQNTENLRLCDSPFRYFSGGNVAFNKKWLDKAGWFDEEFTHWGGEDNEFGYRLYRAGCFFKALDGAMAYHQEPPGKENETDRSAGQAITRKIIEQKVPYFYRKIEPLESSIIRTVPLVSIYIPAFNCQDTIVRCVESALSQTITDLEVCICNDGSTDNTLRILQHKYTNHPRVRFVTQDNGGIAKASNTAVKMCKGFYIGQLDSDDYLEPDAVALCLVEFIRDKTLACVYTTNRNVDNKGNLISNGYNWPVFSREKFSTAMIVHHFRMFTIRAWNLTSGFDEEIENAVDYDMYLKLSEIGKFKHVNRICYNRVLHGENTSIKKIGIQKTNHFLVVNNALKRQGVSSYTYMPMDEDSNSRKFIFENYKEKITNSYSLSKAPIESEVSGCLFSLVYPDKLDNLLDRINNIISYNSHISGVVIHYNEKFISTEIINQINEFEKKNTFKVLLNSRVGYDNFKYRQLEYHLSNFMLSEQEGLKARYWILDNSDSMFVRTGIYDYICNYQVGFQSNIVTGYWKDRVLNHKSLQKFVYSEIGEELSGLQIKGSTKGMFLEYSIAEKVFSIIQKMMKLCIENIDLPNYPADEVWPNLALLIIERKSLSRFKTTNTLTYLPWSRSLTWSKEQIIDARKGSGIPKNKFMINGVFPN